MNFLTISSTSHLVIAAPSWADARRYALVKLGDDVTLSETTEPAVVTLTHHGNDSHRPDEEAHSRVVHVLGAAVSRPRSS